MIGPNGVQMTLCNLCLTEFQDEVGAITNYVSIYEDEEN